jgi:hypothetical protein
MNRSINSIAALTLALCAAQAMADDSVSRATPTDHQMMKECIERQKTADVTMSKAAMTRLCKDQLKQQKQTGTPPEPAPVDSPHN